MSSRPPSFTVARAFWNVVDQGLSAASNVLLAIVVARVSSVDVFGGFALALAGVRLAISVNRALSAEPLVVLRGQDVTARSTTRAWAAGWTLVLSAPAAGALAGSALLLEGPARQPVLAAAVGLPGVLLQDTWRYMQFEARNARRAAIGDLSWFGLQLPLFAVVLLWAPEAWVAVLGWGMAASMVVVGAFMADRIAPACRDGWRWFYGQRDVALRFGAEYLILQLATQGAIVLVAVLGGLEAAGSLRAAETIYGPATVLILSLRVFAMSDARGATADDAFMRTMRNTSAVAVVAVGLVLVAAITLPQDVGRAFLGDSWDGAQDVLVPMGVATMFMAASSGAFAGLRALSAAADSLLVRLVQAPVLVVAVTVGVSAGGAAGAGMGLAVGSGTAFLLSWVRLRAAHTRISTGRDD